MIQLDIFDVGNAVIIIDTSTNSSFTTTTTPYSKKAFGVVTGVGLGVTNDADSDGNCDADDICMVAVGGEVEVTTKNATSASRGDYLYTSDTASSAAASAKQFDGLIGVVSNTANAASGYLKMIFKVQPQVTAAATIDKGLSHEVYRSLADTYNQSSETDRYDQFENVSKGISFDTFIDEIKYDSASSTVPIDPYKQRVGLYGGRTLSNTNTDTAGNSYLGANDANDVYYYDRTQDGETGHDSTPSVLVNLGTDPNWYNGVTLITDCSGGNCGSKTNLSTTYNGSLIKATGTYNTEDGYIDIEIVSTSTSTITYNWDTSGSSYGGETGATATFGVADSLCDDGATCAAGEDTGIDVTFQKTNYKIGDRFRIASWYIEPATANDRGSKQAFPERSYLIGSNTYLDIIDADTNKLWMRFEIGIVSIVPRQLSSIFGLNGKIYMGMVTSGGNAGYIDFINDKGFLWDTANSYTYAGNIAERNDSKTYTNNNDGWGIVAYIVNDIHAAVIPNQPTQEVTVSGWSYFTLSSANETVNLPYKFNSNPNIVITSAGHSSTTVPVSLANCSNASAKTVVADTITTTTFIARESAADATNYQCYTWTATGQVSPRQYVAVATGPSGSDGGTSIINENDQSVTNILIGSQHAHVLWQNKVFFANDGTLYIANNDLTGNNTTLYVYYGASALPSETSWQQYGSYYFVQIQSGSWSTSGPVILGTAGTTAQINTLDITTETSAVDGKSNTIYVGTNNGVSVIQEKQSGANFNDRNNEANGSVKYYTKDYISEEMIGDIRGMWPFYGSGNIANNTYNIDDVSVKSSELRFVKVVIRTRSPAFTRPLISLSKSLICPLVGRTEISGSTKPVGLTTCSTTDFFGVFAFSYFPGVADTKTVFFI